MAVKIPSESEELTGKQIMICIFFRREKKITTFKITIIMCACANELEYSCKKGKKFFS